MCRNKQTPPRLARAGRIYEHEHPPILAFEGEITDFYNNNVGDIKLATMNTGKAIVMYQVRIRWLGWGCVRGSESPRRVFLCLPSGSRACYPPPPNFRGGQTDTAPPEVRVLQVDPETLHVTSTDPQVRWAKAATGRRPANI